MFGPNHWYFSPWNEENVSLDVSAVITGVPPKIAFLLILSKMARLLGHTHTSRLDIAVLSAAVCI